MYIGSQRHLILVLILFGANLGGDAANHSRNLVDGLQDSRLLRPDPVAGTVTGGEGTWKPVGTFWVNCRLRNNFSSL
jgi:hypothetical protein